MANHFIPKSARNEQTFLYFDPVLQSWDTQSYTMAELAELPDITEDSVICTADGATQLTFGELMKKPINRDVYQYEVVTHGRYIGDVFDAAGLKSKLNTLGAKGFRLVGFGTVSGTKRSCSSSKETLDRVVIDSVLGIDSTDAVSVAYNISDYRIAVAIMEKKF